MPANESQARRRAKASTLVILDLLLLLMILGAAIHTAFYLSVRKLGGDLKQQSELLQQRADGLCGESRPTAPAPPDDIVEQLAFLPELTRFGQDVWARYDDCQEPIAKTIPEELLHFRLNEHDKYEPDTDEAAAFRQIFGYVDENLKLRNQIYVIGHTDETGEERPNDELSYRRALEITTKIDAHLRAAGKSRGKDKDYELYPVGMGWKRPEEQRPGEAKKNWHKRCRRIELVFRSLPRGAKNKP